MLLMVMLLFKLYSECIAVSGLYSYITLGFRKSLIEGS